MRRAPCSLGSGVFVFSCAFLRFNVRCLFRQTFHLLTFFLVIRHISNGLFLFGCFWRFNNFLLDLIVSKSLRPLLDLVDIDALGQRLQRGQLGRLLRRAGLIKAGIGANQLGKNSDIVGMGTMNLAQHLSGTGRIASVQLPTSRQSQHGDEIGPILTFLIRD